MLRSFSIKVEEVLKSVSETVCSWTAVKHTILIFRKWEEWFGEKFSEDAEKGGRVVELIDQHQILERR